MAGSLLPSLLPNRDIFGTELTKKDESEPAMIRRCIDILGRLYDTAPVSCQHCSQGKPTKRQPAIVLR